MPAPLLAFLPSIPGPDGFIIFLFTLLFFGAKNLPGLHQGLQDALNQFSRAWDATGKPVPWPCIFAFLLFIFLLTWITFRN
jgi:hypothetical protein